MPPLKNKEFNRSLDLIIKSKESVSKFNVKVPPRHLVEQIIQAGLLAPFAGLTVSKNNSRRFVVIPRESEATENAATLINRRSQALFEIIEKQKEQSEFQRQLGRQSLGEFAMVDQDMISNIGSAPYFIIVAEERGILAEEQLSLAHCLEIMWLKTIALGLNFQLLSIIVQMAEDRAFCGLIDIPFGSYALDGCLIGYSDEAPAPRSSQSEPDIDSVTKWLD